VPLADDIRDAADSIIGNLDEAGYLTASLEEIASSGDHSAEDVAAALRGSPETRPAGVGARDVRECLLLQIESRNGRGGVAWQIVADHLKLVELKQYRELARLLGRPLEHIQTRRARHPPPEPAPRAEVLRAGRAPGRARRPHFKDGDQYIIQLNDEDLPQLRLNANYRRMLDRNHEPSKRSATTSRSATRRRSSS